MKKLAALLLLTAAAAPAQPATFNLGPHGSITLYLLGDWEVDGTHFANRGSIQIKSRRSSVNAACNIGITFPPTDQFNTRARLKMRVETDGYSLAEQSVERKAFAREFNLSTGFGFYCTFTDPDLRGRPPEKGNYKMMSAGKIRLAPDVLLDVSIMADDFRDEPYQQLLGAIEGMEFTAGSGG